MKKKLRHLLAACTAATALAMVSPIVSMAATRGELSSVTSDAISGWAWEVGEYDSSLTVEIRIYKDMERNSVPVKTMTVQANQFSQAVSDSIGDGWHAFFVPVDWNQLGGTEYFVQVYSVMGQTRHQLGSTFSYKPGQEMGSRIITGPGDMVGLSLEESEAESSSKNESSSRKDYVELTGSETYLGAFTVTGYCNCDICSGGHNKTFSGTVPKANHTLSADLTVLPLGSKVWIDGVIYTVEDKGGNVNGQTVDIFYDTHEEALEHGTITEDVYLL